jgi:2-polyprenyl-3-methyl-5-hydroxy-6-metoxy-1,4-benzoquinol methylase
MDMDDHLKVNRKLWDELTPVHVAADFYDVAGFKRGKCTLHAIELEELGEIADKSLLHLQCHFGLDTLSWTRRGAKVDGADFSEKAIAKARELTTELNLPAEFVCCELRELP